MKYYKFTGYVDGKDRMFSQKEIGIVANFYGETTKNFLDTFRGTDPAIIVRDGFEPTVLDLIQDGRMNEALKLYKTQHPDVDDKTAKTKVYSMRQDVRDSRKRNDRIDRIDTIIEFEMEEVPSVD